MNMRTLRNRLLISLLLGVAVFAGLSFYADFQDLRKSLEDFRWELLPLILTLTSMNYVFRFIKWEYYLHLIGVRGLSKVTSFLIFFSGLGMVITPGKVGEWLKSFLLREVHGTPIARSAPILIAERLTDSVALLIMAGIGIIYFGRFWQIFVIVLVGSILIIAIARHRPTAHMLLRLGGRLPLVNRFVPQMEEFYESTYALLAPVPLLLMCGLSTISWFFEVMGFYFTLVGLGIDPSWKLLLQSAFILPISTLASAVLLTPGGLGVAEAGITGLSQALLDISRSAAAVGTLIIRLGTLWFGVIVGLVAFAILGRRLTLDGDLTAAPALATAGVDEEPRAPVPETPP